MTFEHALASFILEQKLRGNADKTVEAYQWFLSYFISWLITNGVTTLDELTLYHVQSYQLYIDSKPAGNKPGKLKKRSVQTYMRHVKAFLRFCHSEGFIVNPIKVRLPKAERPTIEILTGDEISDILSMFSKTEIGLRNYALICLLLDCGLRIGEAVTLKTDNINFENGYIKVIGKGRRERIVPIGLKVRRAMIAYVHKRRVSIHPEHDAFFFLTNEQAPLTISCTKSLMKRLKKKTGIKRLRAHLFRHTFATNFLVHGIGDVYELSRLLGHSQLTTTDMYVQLASYYSIMEKKRTISYLDMHHR